MATAEGTRRFLTRACGRGALHAGNVRLLGQSQLSCAAIGFGAYRIGGGKSEDKHYGALRSALKAGLNLIDTSSHYSAAEGEEAAKHGASEALIGKAVSDAIAEGDLLRDELVLVTKVGHVERGTGRPDGSVTISPHGGDDDWHCIAPSFVEAEVRGSAARLGTAADFVLLHNPEYFLSSQLRGRRPIAEAWEEMYLRLEQTFKALEGLCDEGVIAHGYGVSANFLSCLFSTTGRPNLYEAIAMERMCDAAASAAGGAAHRLRLVQLPLNAIEAGAVLGRGQAIPDAAEGDCALAAKLGLGVMTNRALNTIPLPGMQSGDWGRNTTHLQLKETKPMLTTQALLKRVLSEATDSSQLSLQQLSLRLAAGAPAVSCCLCGLRDDRYVEDASAVLKMPPLATEQVVEAYGLARQALQELGADHNRLW